LILPLAATAFTKSVVLKSEKSPTLTDRLQGGTRLRINDTEARDPEELAA